ncbi:PH domain-containing protein [Secundilactobacillus folii]|nr:PH domain-containing protein [Secundilactobacillus folii]
MTPIRRHLNPLAIVVFWFRYMASLFWLVPVVLFSNGSRTFELLGTAGCFLLLTIMAVVRYWWYRFEIGNQAITIHSGVIFRKQVHIPYAKIQTLQRQQWFYFKPFHVLAVSIETAGQSHDEAEGSLPAVSQRVVDQLQKLVNKQSQDPSSAVSNSSSVIAAQSQPVAEQREDSNRSPELEQNRSAAVSAGEKYKISWRDLNTYALTSVGVVPILLGLLWLYSKLDDLLPDRVMNQAVNTFVHYSFLIIIAVLIFSLLLGTIVSYLTIVQRYYHFVLSKRNQQLTTEKGFFQRNTISASQSRIQAVIFRQTVLRQLLGLVSVQLVLASTATKAEDENNLVMLPVIDRSKVPIVHRFINWVPTDLPAFDPISWAGRWRMIRNAVWLSLIPVVPLVYWLRPWGWWSLLLMPLAVLMGLYAGRQMGIRQIDATHLAIRVGSHFQRDTVIVAKPKLQSVSIKQSIWMKRVELAHLILNIRQGDDVQALRVRYLALADAEQIYGWYRGQTD